MAAKKTVAIIASTEQKTSAVVDKLSGERYRLLLLEKEPGQFSQLSAEIRLQHPTLEFEVVNCLRDGCWEADVIILDVSCGEQKEVAELIKEVATQKPVVNFSDHENIELENLMEYSKVITLINTRESLESSVCSKDAGALMEVSEILDHLKQSKT
jgi:hypothetical protein